MKEIEQFLSIVRETREKKGINQIDIATHLGITQPSYTNIESGKTSLRVEIMFQIAKFLDINLELHINGRNSANLDLDKDIKELNAVKQEVENINSRISKLFDLFNNKNKR